MKLDFVFCRLCNGNHPPGQHHAKGRRATPEGVPPPPPASSWEGKHPTRLGHQKPKPPRMVGTPIPVVKPTIPELRSRIRKVEAKKSLKPAKPAPDFIEPEGPIPPPPPKPPKVRVPSPDTPPRKAKAEYRKKMKLLMRQKRAAAREGVTLEAYREKNGDGFMPPRLRRCKR